MNFDKDCTTPLAKKLISLYAEYVEGEIESSGKKYNELIKTATVKDILYVVFHSPFERHAFRLYTLLKENNVDIPKEIAVKVAKDKKFIIEMDKLMVS